MKLTQRTVDTLDLPKGKSEAIIFDEDLPGFGLRMRAGGKRSWVYVKDGVPGRIPISALEDHMVVENSLKAKPKPTGCRSGGGI